MSAEGTKDEVKGPQPEVRAPDFWFHYIGCQKPPVHPSHDCESSLAQHRSPHDHHFAPLPWSDSATLSNLSWRGNTKSQTHICEFSRCLLLFLFSCMPDLHIF